MIIDLMDQLQINNHVINVGKISYIMNLYILKEEKTNIISIIKYVGSLHYNEE